MKLIILALLLVAPSAFAGRKLAAEIKFNCRVADSGLAVNNIIGPEVGTHVEVDDSDYFSANVGKNCYAIKTEARASNRTVDFSLIPCTAPEGTNPEASVPKSDIITLSINSKVGSHAKFSAVTRGFELSFKTNQPSPQSAYLFCTQRLPGL